MTHPTDPRAVVEIDRSDAVNLARNLKSDAMQNPTPKGICILIDAVLAMDAALTAANEYLKQPQGEDFAATQEANVQWMEAYARLRLESDSLKKDAELGKIAMRFVDRAGDIADCDPAERICSEFYAAMSEAVERLYVQPRATHPQATEPISEYCEHGIRWDTVCRSCDELPAAAMPVGELTESELMKCIAQAGCFGTVELSYESGPYDIDRPTLNATKLARAILAAASTQSVREPLTDDEAFNLCRSASNRIDVLRKTEAAHGIK